MEVREGMIPDVSDTVLTKLALEKVQVYARTGMSSYVMRNAKLERWFDPMMDELVFTLHSHVLGHKVEVTPVEVVFEWAHWPSWWQHCKNTLFPTFSRWLRRPPRLKLEKTTKIVRLDKYRTFPECTYDYPKELGRWVETVVVTRP